LVLNANLAAPYVVKHQKRQYFKIWQHLCHLFAAPWCAVAPRLGITVLEEGDSEWRTEREIKMEEKTDWGSVQFVYFSGSNSASNSASISAYFPLFSAYHKFSKSKIRYVLESQVELISGTGG
jgi:hypothetical protein